MTLKQTLMNMVGEEKTAEIMKVATAAQRKYVATQQGKDARSRANLKYRTKVNETDPQMIKDHLIKFKLDNPDSHCEIVTTLWKHYSADAEKKITRKQYQTLLDTLELPVKNPHWRGNQKYYADAYDLSA
jgi:hypothetical protein